MKLGILETGSPPGDLAARFGDYPAMFRRLLGEGAYDYRTYDAAGGVLPERPEDCAAYLITGSPAGVYDPLPWIAPLERFLVEAKGKAALVGVCFGHQIMAQAFGGQAAKAPAGWGVGLHEYEVSERAPWMDDAPVIRAAASHQDQVTAPPPGARVLAGSEFSPFGMLAYDDQPAFSIQLHPEFEPDYAKALIEQRRGVRFTDAAADRGVASFTQADDRARLAGWIRRFLGNASHR